MRKFVEISKLNRRITFQAETKTVNQFNEGVPTWADSFDKWAMMVARPGRATVEADQLTQETNYVFYTQYEARITERLRIKYKGKIFRIVSITEPVGFQSQLWEIKTELLPEVDA